MRRVSIVGSSGSGKSTAGRALASRLGVEFVELDAIFHQPGWTDLPLEDFRARVGEHAAEDAWVSRSTYVTPMMREPTNRRACAWRSSTSFADAAHDHSRSPWGNVLIDQMIVRCDSARDASGDRGLRQSMMR